MLGETTTAFPVSVKQLTAGTMPMHLQLSYQPNPSELELAEVGKSLFEVTMSSTATDKASAMEKTVEVLRTVQACWNGNDKPEWTELLAVLGCLGFPTATFSSSHDGLEENSEERSSAGLLDIASYAHRSTRRLSSLLFAILYVRGRAVTAIYQSKCNEQQLELEKLRSLQSQIPSPPTKQVSFSSSKDSETDPLRTGEIRRRSVTGSIGWDPIASHRPSFLASPKLASSRTSHMASTRTTMHMRKSKSLDLARFRDGGSPEGSFLASIPEDGNMQLRKKHSFLNEDPAFLSLKHMEQSSPTRSQSPQQMQPSASPAGSINEASSNASANIHRKRSSYTGSPTPTSQLTRVFVPPIYPEKISSSGSDTLSNSSSVVQSTPSQVSVGSSGGSDDTNPAYTGRRVKPGKRATTETGSPPPARSSVSSLKTDSGKPSVLKKSSSSATLSLRKRFSNLFGLRSTKSKDKLVEEDLVREFDSARVKQSIIRSRPSILPPKTADDKSSEDLKASLNGHMKRDSPSGNDKRAADIREPSKKESTFDNSREPSQSPHPARPKKRYSNIDKPKRRSGVPTDTVPNGVAATRPFPLVQFNGVSNTDEDVPLHTVRERALKRRSYHALQVAGQQPTYNGSRQQPPVPDLPTTRPSRYNDRRHTWAPQAFYPPNQFQYPPPMNVNRQHLPQYANRPTTATPPLVAFASTHPSMQQYNW
ncbi:uncharacterized protein EV422DRAFT_620369 [Fimicolochytrium jonesii]|uniref:uncharacterized protein n=1 Tax=Fimicolochytrium jonesii TaxID=1396493 RepID=UPI0022FEAD5F|nr:uncharacterized protein EV422DRAFT_620369 [Fimicolochytrium jonesii]KAI8820441.1 hypothetical protein EV422DRAFT_620369 [Fimicolochytrium jonesii]